MKKILLFLMTICAIASFNTANAQSCDLQIANLVITPHTNPGPMPVGSDCSFTFDASFDIVTNSGFKYLFFHSWKAEDYPATPVFDCTKSTSAQDPGTSAQLGTARNTPNKSFLDMGFIGLNNYTFVAGANPVDVTSNIATTYPHDASVELVKPTNSIGLHAEVTKRGTDTLHFTITNIEVLVYGGCNPVNVKTDIWGSNANANDPKAQCYICGFQNLVNNPFATILKSCTASPFAYTLGINNGGGSALSAVYRIYADADGDNIMEPNSADDQLIFTSGTVSLPANTNTVFGPTTLPAPYCCTAPWSQYGIYATVQIIGIPGLIGVPEISNPGCATLPIKLRSFTAERNKSNVELKWTTEMEDNNKGFYIERKLSNGGWQNIGFVPSKATNGNSFAPLSYDLSDFNNTKGVSQYRLRQVDIDGKQAYSMIRSVRGEGQKGSTIIYPNPSNDGKVSVLFENANSVRDVSLLDVSGRTIRQWKGFTNNNIQIDNLNAGFYTIRIVDTQTGEQVVEKFIVNKR